MEYTFIFFLFLSFSILIASSVLLLKIKGKKTKIIDNKEGEYFKEKGYINRLLNYEVVKKIDKVLKEANYPVKTTEYIAITVLVLIMSVFFLFKNGTGLLTTLPLYILITINLYIYIKISNVKNELRISLCDIQEVFYFQSKIGTSVDIILANAARIAEGSLKPLFKESTSIYNLTRNIEKALDVVDSRYNLMDLKALCISIRQREQTGYSEENHKAQLTMMKRNKRLRKIYERQKKRGKLIICSVLLLICCTALAGVPLLNDALNGIDMILR